MTQQLPLNLKLPFQASFENYIDGSNTAVINFLKDLFLSGQEWYAFLWGVKSTGKTHLLNACCTAVTKNNKTAFYLDLCDYKLLKPQILIDLEQYDLICIDNIELINTAYDWQEAFFYFYNRCQIKKSSLLIAASMAPVQLDFELADLKSRLSAGLILNLQMLTDDEKILGLQQYAKAKGFDLSNEVTQYIVSHYSRDMEKLIQLLDHIDQQSLAEQRRVTIPFIKNLQL